MTNRDRAVAACSVAAIASLLAAVQAMSAPSRPPVVPASRVFKNIKVLKRLPANELIPVMRRFNESLGVGCDFCHVMRPDHSGFQLDAKPQKQAARKMILMVQDINAHQKVIGGKATCYMCHHGHAQPEINAPSRFTAPPNPAGK